MVKMDDFNIIVPFTKDMDKKGSLRLFGGIASSTSIDRDNERMDKSVLKKIANGLEGATVFFNHNIKGLGVGIVSKSEETGNKVHIEVVPTIAKGMEDVVTQIGEGILKSFSIGGKILNLEVEYDKNLQKDIKVIKDVEIYEVSVVGIPANKDASILSYIAKSFKGADMNDEEKKKEEKKPDEEKKKEEKQSGLLDSPEFKKFLGDLKSEYDTRFGDLEKDLKIAKEKNEELEKGLDSQKARNEELRKLLDNRVKSLESEDPLKEEAKVEKTKKTVNEEPVRFL